MTNCRKRRNAELETMRTRILLVLIHLLPILKLNSVALVRERTIPTERPPHVGEVVPTFEDRGCHVVSATISTVVNLGLLIPFLKSKFEIKSSSRTSTMSKRITYAGT
jgi:hypothetical protein